MHELATTVITVAEIECGIQKARLTAPETADDVEEWLKTILADGQPQILGMSIAASRLIGRMYMTPRLRSFVITDPTARKPASGADLAIAAIATTEGAVVATAGIDHFLRIHAEFPLPGLFNPVSGEWHVEPTLGPGP
ncbi:MAG TPA: hypothetical protein VMB34_25850 [Acetobacteraceae bacterium]|nr:hypothetical protein [Acetobacteraceae bacterium]